MIVDVRVALPDDWWPIPLASETAIRNSVTELIDRQVAPFGDDAVLDSVRAALLEQADVARANGAHLLALCRHRHGEIPIPASLVLRWIDAEPRPDHRPGDRLQELRDALVPDGSLDLARIPPGPVLRRVRTDRLDLPGTEESIESLVADYWLERPDDGGLVHLAFSSPVLRIRDAWLDLWDAIVSALRWVER